MLSNVLRWLITLLYQARRTLTQRFATPYTGAASNITLGLIAGLAMIMLAVAVRTSLAARMR